MSKWWCAVQGSADEVMDAMAKIFVWLRYSSSRQLTWQRNYNTQPRILGEAQTRLTNAIAQVTPRYWVHVSFMLIMLIIQEATGCVTQNLHSAIPLTAVFNDIEIACRIIAVHNLRYHQISVKQLNCGNLPA